MTVDASSSSPPRAGPRPSRRLGVRDGPFWPSCGAISSSLVGSSRSFWPRSSCSRSSSCSSSARSSPSCGYARPGYEQVLFPAWSPWPRSSTGLQSTALPLVIEFSYSNEIEDRLLAPLPIGAVAVEKVVFAAMRACVAAAVMFPVGVWILGTIPWQASTGVAVVVMVILVHEQYAERVDAHRHGQRTQDDHDHHGSYTGRGLPRDGARGSRPRRGT